MTVRKAATFGFDGGKGSGVAASGVVASLRRIPSPASCGSGSIRPSGGPRQGLADVGLAHLALGRPAALAVQGEALQQLSVQEGQASGQQDGRAQMKGPPVRLLGGTLASAPAGNTVVENKKLTTATWSWPLPGQGGAEEGAERPTRRRVWPVEPGVPASPSGAARARHGEGAALFMRHGPIDKDLSAGRQFRCQLVEFVLGEITGEHDEHVGPGASIEAEPHGLVQQILRGNSKLASTDADALGRLEAGGPGAVVALFGKSPRTGHAYGASPWRTRTSWRSGRSSATGTAPNDSLSIAMARSVGQGAAPFSRLLIRPRDDRPSRSAREA